MKVNLYMDVYNPAMHPTIAITALYATTHPIEKMNGVKRFKVVVDIPNPEVLWAGQIDGTLPVEDMYEVDKNKTL